MCTVVIAFSPDPPCFCVRRRLIWVMVIRTQKNIFSSVHQQTQSVRNNMMFIFRLLVKIIV